MNFLCPRNRTLSWIIGELAGSVGFFWLLLREHLMKIERQLGNTRRSDCGRTPSPSGRVRSDFVVRQAVR
jgi:hypothetical protein